MCSSIHRDRSKYSHRERERERERVCSSAYSYLPALDGLTSGVFKIKTYFCLVLKCPSLASTLRVQFIKRFFDHAISMCILRSLPTYGYYLEINLKLVLGFIDDFFPKMCTTYSWYSSSPIGRQRILYFKGYHVHLICFKTEILFLAFHR